MGGWLWWLLTLPIRLVDHLLHFAQLGVVEVLAVRSDTRSQQLVHIWYARSASGSGRYGATPEANVRMFGHVVLNTTTWRLTSGLRQTGTKLELDSPFAERSLAHVAQKLKLPSALGPAVKQPHGCPLHQSRSPKPPPPMVDGPALLLHEREYDGGADSVSGEVHELRYVQGGQERWKLRGQSIWMGKRFVFAGPDGTVWLLYHGLDLRLRAWRLADGEVLADRYLLGGLL